MKHLFLMRHGDAPYLADDKARRLSPLGRVEAALMGAFLEERMADASLARLDHVGVSDAPRTAETFEAMRLRRAPAAPAVDGRLYTAAPQPLLAHFGGLEETVQAALTITHHPSVDRAVELFTGAAPAEGAATGCLACLRFDGPWSALAPGAASLLWRVAPAGVFAALRPG